MGATASLAHRYTAAHPQSAAKCLQALPPDEAAAFLTDAEPGTVAAVVKKMSPRAATTVLEHFAVDRKAQIIEMLDLTTIVVMLRQQSVESRDTVIKALPASLGRRVRHALALRPGTVGSVVDSTVAAFHADTTVAEVRAIGSDPRLSCLYVVGPEHRLIGVLHRRDLETADSEQRLQAIMSPRVQAISATAPLAGLLNHSAWFALDVLPVVDDRGAYVGVVRHKSLRASPQGSKPASGSPTAVSALLELGEVYWSGLFSVIDALASPGVPGTPRLQGGQK